MWGSGMFVCLCTYHTLLKRMGEWLAAIRKIARKTLDGNRHCQSSISQLQKAVRAWVEWTVKWTLRKIVKKQGFQAHLAVFNKRQRSGKVGRGKCDISLLPLSDCSFNFNFVLLFSSNFHWFRLFGHCLGPDICCSNGYHKSLPGVIWVLGESLRCYIQYVYFIGVCLCLYLCAWQLRLRDEK